MTRDDWINATASKPEDLTVKLVFADWLEERGDHGTASGYRALAALKSWPLPMPLAMPSLHEKTSHWYHYGFGYLIKPFDTVQMAIAPVRGGYAPQHFVPFHWLAVAFPHLRTEDPLTSWGWGAWDWICNHNRPASGYRALEYDVASAFPLLDPHQRDEIMSGTMTKAFMPVRGLKADPVYRDPFGKGRIGRRIRSCRLDDGRTLEVVSDAPPAVRRQPSFGVICYSSAGDPEPFGPVRYVKPRRAGDGSYEVREPIRVPDSIVRRRKRFRRTAPPGGSGALPYNSLAQSA